MVRGPHDDISTAETKAELESFRNRLRAKQGGTASEPLQTQVIKYNRNAGGQTDTIPKRLFKSNPKSAWIITGVGGADALEYRFPEDADERLPDTIGVSLSGKTLADIPDSSRTNELITTIRKRLQGEFRFGCVRSKWDNIWPPDQSDFDLD